MRDLGARLAAELRAGDLVVASGPLGAGKTTLVHGIGAALGVEGEVTSPTFVIAREHRGPLPLIHVDAYRLRPDGGGAIDPAWALADLDLRTDDAVVIMEWGAGLNQVLSEEFLEITLAFGEGEHRNVTFAGHGERWKNLVERAATW